MDALDYTRDLVSFASISRVSNEDVSNYVDNALTSLGFDTERLEYRDAANELKVSVVGRKGAGTGGWAYFAHTDVVPANPWFTDQHGPFEPTVVDGRLYGRGSCDMKGSIGCALAAAAAIDERRLKAPLYITCTADEEVGYHGAAQVARESQIYRELVDGNARGIIGEPTELEVVYAHKGSYGFIAHSHGRAAHSSTSEGINANLAMIPFLQEMKAIHDETLVDPEWLNDEFDPPCISFNLGINDGNTALNITAPKSTCSAYFRPMPGQDANRLLDRVRQAADRHGLELQVPMQGPPMYVDPNSEFVQEVLALVDRDTPRTVSYGTDGAMFGDLKQKVVFGPGSIRQAHTHDEWIDLKQLELGTAMFTRMIEKWCC